MADKLVRFPNYDFHEAAVPIQAVDQGDGTYRLMVQDSAIAAAITAGSAYVLSGEVTIAAGTAEIGSLGTSSKAIGKLAAGTALIGKVGIDQVTANANEVVLKESTAAIGTVEVTAMPDVSGSVTVSGTVEVSGSPAVEVVTLPAVTGAVTAYDLKTKISVTPTLSAAGSAGGSYVSGAYVGEDATAMEFANAAASNAGGGTILSAVLIDYSAGSAAGELWLFDEEPTPPDDGEAWDLSDEDAALCIGVVPFSTYYASDSNSVSPAQNLNIPFKCGTGSKSLFGCFVTRDTPTYTDGDLTFRLIIRQDG